MIIHRPVHPLGLAVTGNCPVDRFRIIWLGFKPQSVRQLPQSGALPVLISARPVKIRAFFKQRYRSAAGARG